MRAAVIVIAATLLLPASVRAQDTTTCWFDTLGHTFRDTVAIGLAAERPPANSRSAKSDYLLTAQAIQAYFHPPEMVRLPLWARTVGSRASLAGKYPPPDSLHILITAPYGLYGHVLFRLDATGRLADSTIAIYTASPDIREAITTAIRRADSALAFAPPSDDVIHDGGKIRLQFVQVLSRPDSKYPSIPLVRVVQPAIELEEPPAVLSFPTLRYPATLREEHLGDRVVLEFVVGADGRLAPGTIDLLQAQYRDFALEAMRGARDARFRPARVGGCSVPTIVRVPIDFKIRRID